MGKVNGKIGAVVYATTAGQIIAREYNPNVANPNTVKQVNQRARLKLASQIAAAVAPVIGYPREGLVSARNAFIKANNEFFTATNGRAQVSYENLQLVKGNAGLPGIAASRSSQDGLVVKLQASADTSVSRVVYCVFKKTDENTLQYIASAVESTAGDDGLFSHSFDYFDGELVLWAYGVLDVTKTAKAKYNNYEVANAQDIATLIMSRQLTAGDYQFTKTRGTTIFSGDSENVQAEEGQVMVYLTASGPGTITCDKFSGSRGAVATGTQITLTATPNSGCQFIGFKKNGVDTYFATTSPYTMQATELLDIVAVFNNPSSPGGDNGGGLDMG